MIKEVVTSLLIVLKPKPATVRLVEIEVDGGSKGGVIEVEDRGGIG